MIYDNILDKMADVEESTNTYCRYVMDSVIPLSTDILREYSGNGDIGENNVETILHMINIWCDDRISNYVEFKDCLSSYLPIWKSIHVIKSNEIVIAKYNREKKMYYVNLLNVITVAIKYGGRFKAFYKWQFKM
jgi:hypothetical protein